MRIYIDFDGVIKDTDAIIDLKIKNENRHEFIKKYDWNLLLEESMEIANSIQNIKNSKYETYLLSKISTLQEATAKIKYLRGNDVNINLHFVPTGVAKSDIVEAKGNILIDDKIANLEKWEENGGIPIFFNKDNNDIDIYNKINTKYYKISSLEIITKDNILNNIKTS